MRISRSTGAVTGFVLLLLGIWGGIIPFVGPYFGYAFGSHATWHYTANRLWLDILPAVAVIVGALILLRAGHRVSGTLGSWLAMAGGAWFAVGPAVSQLWDHAAGPIGGPLFGHTRQMLELVGTFYGLGVVVVGLAAFAHGRVVSRPALVIAEAKTGEPLAEPTDTPSEPTDTPSEPTDTPSEPTDTPSEPTDTPSEPTDTTAEPDGAERPEEEHVTAGSASGSR